MMLGSCDSIKKSQVACTLHKNFDVFVLVYVFVFVFVFVYVYSLLTKLDKGHAALGLIHPILTSKPSRILRERCGEHFNIFVNDI